MLKFNDIKNVKAYKISEGVVLYKNVIKNVEEVLSFFKDAELYEEDTYMMKKFYKWGYYGTMTEIDSASFHNFSPQFFNSDSPEEVKQKNSLESIHDAYKFVRDDFMSKYGNKDIWPDHYKKVNLFNESNSTKIAFLKYDKKHVMPFKGKGTIFNFTAFHSDYFDQDMDTPGYKLIFTVMLYLNDDYDNGEICFWDGENIIGYKPKAGDIVVFPSCEPFYHGVLNIYNADRYAIRMNYYITTEGSEEFKSGNFQPSLNLTNYKVGYEWLKDGVLTVTNPEMQKIKRVNPPIILDESEMERMSIDAKD
jgi:hypothetical protein